MPFPAPDRPTEACPGCGAVLVPLPDDGTGHPGGSSSCSRLFEVTLRGLREEGYADPAAAAAVALADEAYGRQHPVPAGTAVPVRWRTTIADVAADLDVIDLPVLVESWARSVSEDQATAALPRP
jgi:hypothetical protein